MGIVAGWLAERVMQRDHSLITNLIVGIIGATIGGFLFSSLIGLRYVAGFNLASIVVATAGAISLLAVVGAVKGRSSS